MREYYSRTDLGQIWQIADTENRGFLTPSGFGVVLRLIGHAQAGRPPSAEIATQRRSSCFSMALRTEADTSPQLHQFLDSMAFRPLTRLLLRRPVPRLPQVQ